MAGFDVLGLSPLVILLVVLGVLIFLKMLKWIVLIAVLAGVYVVLKMGLVPGVSF
jgi:hypothetical protein